MNKKAIKRFFKNNIGIIICIVVFLTLIFTSIIQINWINNSSKQLLYQINNTKQTIAEENWREAKQNITKLDKQWRQEKKKWSILLNHTKMDFIDESLKRCIEMTKNSAKSDSLAELNVIHHLIVEISQEQIPTIRNIF